MDYGALHPGVRAFLEEAEQCPVLSPEEQAALCARQLQGDTAAGETLLRAQYPMLGDLIQHLPRDFKTPELTRLLRERLEGLTADYDFCGDAAGFRRVFSREMRAVVRRWMEERTQI